MLSFATETIDALRGHMAEFGIIGASGAHGVKPDQLEHIEVELTLISHQDVCEIRCLNFQPDLNMP